MKQEKKIKIKKNNKLIMIGLITSLIVLSIMGFTLARYIIETNSEKKLLEAQNFYFSSNYLTEESDNIYTISDYSDGDEIAIEVYNYQDELRYTTTDVIYEVISDRIPAEDIIQAEFVGTDLKVSEVKVKVKKEYFVDGIFSFTLTAKSKSPYEKMLSATFNVYQAALAEDAYMEVVDNLNSYTVAVAVTSEGKEGEITVNYPATLAPDLGDERITEATDTYFKFIAQKNSVYEFTLFKINLDDLYGMHDTEPFQIVAKVVGTERLPTDALIGRCDDQTVQDPNKWGLYEKNEGDLTYVTDENGNVAYESGPGSSMTNKIPVSEPVNEYYSINVTIRTDITANTLDASLGGTVVAISPVWGQQIAWIAVKRNVLEIYSYQYYSPGLAQGNGYVSIDITEYNNQYLNIILTGENGGESNVYINGDLVRTFNSGTLEFQNEPELTIGDLRPNRGLYFIGNIYNFTLYNRILEDYEIRTVYNYYKERLNM